MKSESRRYPYGDQPSQFADLVLPEGNGPFPVAILVHGGFWKNRISLDIMSPMVADLTARGIATWNIEYRRVGEEGGGWPGTFQDVARATDHLREVARNNRLDLNRVLVVGHSAGGQIGLWLAARHLLPDDNVLKTSDHPLDIKTVVSLAGVCDLALMEATHRMRISEMRGAVSDNPVYDLLEGTPFEVPERYAFASPIQLLSVQSEQILIHGGCDLNVPIGISHSYYNAAMIAGAPVELIEIQNAEHFKVINPRSDCWPIIARAILQAAELPARKMQ
ncbi:MAG: alpha/beta hydrolase [Gemmobacter sp.]|jgi:acetyl esterase/lipase|nr:alpha/beta hydrolase [Gemmobacter sp.]